MNKPVCKARVLLECNTDSITCSSAKYNLLRCIVEFLFSENIPPSGVTIKAYIQKWHDFKNNLSSHFL